MWDRPFSAGKTKKSVRLAISQFGVISQNLPTRVANRTIVPCGTILAIVLVSFRRMDGRLSGSFSADVEDRAALVKALGEAGRFFGTDGRDGDGRGELKLDLGFGWDANGGAGRCGRDERAYAGAYGCAHRGTRNACRIGDASFDATTEPTTIAPLPAPRRALVSVGRVLLAPVTLNDSCRADTCGRPK